jgi:beta-N-acetylhexosaminidase
MIRKIITIILSMTVLLLINACSKDNIEKNINQSIHENQDKTSMSNHTGKPVLGEGNREENTLPPKIDTILEELNEMSLNDKIGQMIIAGFDGTTINSETQSLINKYKLGGLILYQTNVKDATQLVNLTNALKTSNSHNKVPLFLSIDQEGGRINRMPSSIVNTPSARIIGEQNDEKFAFNIGNVIANELQSFGFNTDFAPVLDIQTNPNNTVIGDRSFGASSSIVSTLGVNMMRGLSSGKIIPVIKHFPGHGDTSVDSHLQLPLVKNDLTRLKKVELVPFTNAIKNQADMVMVAHILVHKIDPNYPASMSKTIITNSLRNQLGFDGVVITDDMTMGAITKNYKLNDAAVRSIDAGSDIILVGHGINNVATVYNSILEAVKNHIISEDTINKSVYRILALKHKYNVNNDHVSPVNVTRLNNQISQTISKNRMETNTTKENLLLNIATKANEGLVINCDFHVGNTTIDVVRKNWGKEDKQDYVAAAQGTYSTFTNKNIVVAYDKNPQLFEIRSFDPRLKVLTIQDVKDYFGPPKTEITTSTEEEIINYAVQKYTLKFVFSKSSHIIYLDHYSLYDKSVTK